MVIFGATLHVEETLRKTDKKQNVKLKKYSTIGRQKVRLGKVFPYSLPSVGPSVQLIPVYRQSARR